jgi:phospholipid/cholesterol/gamma-HCH transport system substrate-binding protein
LALACCIGLSGCGFHGIFSLPLPGAVATGSDTYTVGVQFSDVLDLVPYAAVKVNGATVGHVKSVQLQDGHALVECQLLDSVRLPSNAIARIEETSLLGEKFVEIEKPAGQAPVGQLRNGAVITLSHTETDFTVEQVLGALSAVLNGGGLSQVHTIAQEVDSALNGHTAVARDLIGRLRDFAAGLNQQKQQILRAITGVDQLARTIQGQEGELVQALDTMPAALQALTQDRHQLTTMLVSVQHLGHVAVHVVDASEQSLLANLRNLQPTLARLAKVGTEIPKTLGILITYPTADSVQKEYFGDYGNISLSVDLSGSSLATFLKATQLGTPGQPATNAGPQHTKTPTRQQLPTKQIVKLSKRLTRKLERKLHQGEKIPSRLRHRLHRLHKLHKLRTLHRLQNPPVKPGNPLHSITHDVDQTSISGLLLGAS